MQQSYGQSQQSQNPQSSYSQAQPARDNLVLVKPTWGLAWGLLWRQFLITLGIYVVIMIPLIMIFGIAAFLGKQ